MENSNATRSITYLLGAGASANAIPTVARFKDGLRALVGCFNNVTSNGDSGSKKLYEDLLWLAEQHDTYYSIDTAAKVFFHQEGVSSVKLKRLKRTVLIYFLLEQLPLPELRTCRGTGHKDPIDSRYFRLLAYFLGSNSMLEIPSNLHFISWNYDLQLELAFSHFDKRGNLKAISEGLNALPRAGHYRWLKSGIGAAKVIHLNGVAGLLLSEKDDDFIENFIHDCAELTLADVLMKLKSNNFFEQFDFNDTINFAWEREGLSREYFNRAQEIMSKTDDLVVIGYSFPNFNRFVDKELMKPFRKVGDSFAETFDLRRIYIQDLNSTDRAEALKSQFDISDKIIRTINSVDEFFIPPTH